jgi:hypothetical protein
MDLSLLNKILHVLPDDMIWEVSSYFILEIPKSDKRMIMLNRFLKRRNQNSQEGFYSDGIFRYRYFTDFHFYFSIHYLPGMFVEYVVCNGNPRTKEQRNTRIWMDGKVEDYNGCWTARAPAL